MPDFLNSDWFAAAVLGIVSWVGNRIWTRSSDKTQKKIEAAVAEARALISQLVETAKPGTTVEQIVIWCKGAVAIQLAKVGLSKNDLLVRALVNAAIAEGVGHFISRSDRQSLPPILSKLPK